MIETAFDEIKPHLRGSNVVIRSKLLQLVRQDVFGLLLAHYGVRWVMHDAVLSEDISTEELSFVHTLRVVHRKLPWFVSPLRIVVASPTCSDQRSSMSDDVPDQGDTIRVV